MQRPLAAGFDFRAAVVEHLRTANCDIVKEMPDTVQGRGKRAAFSIALVLGWLLPGAGHLLTRHWVRALLLFLSITTMFWLGIAMQGKLYQPNTDDPLGMLGFLGDLGAGIFYFVGNFMGLGRLGIEVATADYGTKFVVVAGLLNFISAVDAHNLRIGRKAA